MRTGSATGRTSPRRTRKSAYAGGRYDLPVGCENAHAGCARSAAPRGRHIARAHGSLRDIPRGRTSHGRGEVVRNRRFVPDGVGESARCRGRGAGCRGREAVQDLRQPLSGRVRHRAVGRAHAA